MIFSELYSAYYNTVAHIISAILEGEHGEKELGRIVYEYAFGESTATIIPSLKSGKWQLVKPDMTTVLRHKPTMPLTNLQKRWLKAISLDPRIRLFDARIIGLDDVEPLFVPDDYYVYDKYSDGDPYDDEEYIKRFRFLLSAIRNRTPIKLNMVNKNGKIVYTKCLPLRLEYSEKDDKFRLITSGCRYLPTVNLAKIGYAHASKPNFKCCFAKDTGNHDCATILMKYDNGVHLSYVQNFVSRFFAATRGARLIGFKGTLEFDFVTEKIKFIDHFNRENVQDIEVNTDGMHSGGDKLLIDNFIEVMEGSANSKSPLMEGIISAKMCMTAKESAKKNKLVKFKI
jgi:hypothetical protein